MKRIFLILGLSLAVAGCTDVEELEMDVPSVEKDLSQVQAYKEEVHPLSIVWFSNWKADGNMNSYLNTLPDSLDIVILEERTETLTEAQKTDLKVFQEQKGSKVLALLDLDTQYETYQVLLEDAEKTGEEKAEEKAAEEGREATMDEINVAVEAEIASAKAEFAKLFDTLPDAMMAWIDSNGFDGLTLRITVLGDIFYRELVEKQIVALGSKIGRKAGNKLFCLEGDSRYANNNCGLFSYVISTTVNAEKLAFVQQEFEQMSRMAEFVPEQFICYLSVDGESWKEPYSDIISTVPVTATKAESLALWKPSGGENIGGMALKGIEKHYDNDYAVLRETIQYLNLK